VWCVCVSHCVFLTMFLYFSQSVCHVFGSFDHEFEEKVKFIQYLYKLNSRILGVTEEAWKCFRCNLTFKDESIAHMHNDISNHSVSKIKTLAA